MKKFLIALSLLVSVGMTQVVTAQVARETSVTFNKVSQNAIVADFKCSKDALETVLKKRFSEAKLSKSRSASNKFQKFEGVNLNEVSLEKMDVYYRVTGKKDNATVEFLLSKGYDNFINSQTDATTVANLKNFIASLEQDLIKHNLLALIEAKEKEIKAGEKTLDSRKSDISKAEKELEKAKAEANKQERVVNTLKGELDKLNAQK